jgi:spore maturation protein B
MRIITLLSELIIPIVIVYILSYGYSKGIKVYEVFIEGASEGFRITLDILPTLIGLMMAVGILRASGALELICRLLTPLAELIGFPVAALPITFMRLVSSSASTGILLDTFKTYGTDSFVGRFVSVMMSSTETVLYTMSLYFMSVKISKTRYTLAGALIANIAGVVASLLLCNRLWGG